MYGTGYLLGILLAILFYCLVILPGDRRHYRKRLSLIRKKLNKPIEYLDASGRLTIGFVNVNASSYSGITNAVVAHFDLRQASTRVHETDTILQDFKKGNDVIGLEWENRSGYNIKAKNQSSEPLVHDVAKYVQTYINL